MTTADLTAASAAETTGTGRRAGGWAGILAGVGLAAEAALWMVSGWTPSTFADPNTAVEFLRNQGGVLRLAVLTGFLNLVFAVVFLGGLASHLRARAPGLAAASLWFGLLGVGTHILVPLAYWYGVPAFVGAEPAAATASWTGYSTLVNAANGAGSLFLGLAMATAGWAVVSRHALPVVLGWLGLVAGVASALGVFAPDTPLTTLTGLLYVPALLLAIVFRAWGGIALLRAT
jgi:hypothetical protein